MKDQGPDDKKPNDAKESERRRKRWQSALVGSQFAYTLVIATLLMGWIGHWLGSLLGGTPWTLILMFLFGGVGFAAEMWRMLKFFSPKDGDDNDGGSDGHSGHANGTKFGIKRHDRMPDGPEGDIERGPYEDDDRRDNDDIERGGGEPERRGGDDIERPGEAYDRPFTGSPFGNLPGDGLSRDELDEIIREIEGLTKVEREELDREPGRKPDGTPADETVADDSSGKPQGDGKDNKNNKGSNE